MQLKRTATMILALPFLAAAGVISSGSGVVTDTTTGYTWLTMSQSQGMSYDQVEAQLGPGGEFAGYQYATVAEVLQLWGDAGILGGPNDGTCSPAGQCLSEVGDPTAVAAFIGLMGDTWASSYGFTGMLGLTSTPYTSPWPGCDPYTCYVTPEIRLYTGPNPVPDDVVVGEGLRDTVAGSSYGSWLVDPPSVPEPAQFMGCLISLLLAGVGYRKQAAKAAMVRYDAR